MRKLLEAGLKRVLVASIALTTCCFVTTDLAVQDMCEGQYIVIDRNAGATLKPLIHDLVKQQGLKASKGLQLCYSCMQKGDKKVKIESLIDALSEIYSYLHAMNISLAQTTRSSDVTKAKDVVVPALVILEELQTVFESALAKKGVSRITAKDTYNLLEQVLGDLPQQADIESLVEITRDIVLQGKGIRQIVVDTVVPLLVTIDSKVDVIDSKVSALSFDLASCCDATESNFDKVESKLDILLQAPQDPGLSSKVDAVDSKLAECCSKIEGDFAGTWTALDACCSAMDSNFSAVAGTLATVDSKVNELALDFQNTWTALDGCCSAIENNFVSTWTILGNALDSSVDLVDFSTVEQVDNAQMSIISWLKSIARQMTIPQA